MNWLKIALAIFQLAPDVLKLISNAEAAIGAGNGTIKKAIVMAPLEDAPVEVKTAVSGFVDTVVAEKKKVVAVP